MREGLLRVRRVEAFIMPTPPHVPVITCHLEDGRQFNLYYVPLEIVIAINRMQGGDYDVDRESVFDILPALKDELTFLSRRIGNVYIDSIDYETMLYSATVEIKANGLTLRRRMIPSHAVFLALMFDKPIYVKDELVKYQEYLEKSEEFGEEEER